METLREGFQAPLGGMLRMSRQMRPSAVRCGVVWGFCNL